MNHIIEITALLKEKYYFDFFANNGLQQIMLILSVAGDLLWPFYYAFYIINCIIIIIQLYMSDNQMFIIIVLW